MKHALVALLVLSGCASTTRIYSKPSGATLVLDDEKLLGKTPLQYKEMVWIWTKHEIDVVLEGYQPATLTIESAGINAAGFAVCACTLGVLLPSLFASRYAPQYVVELQPKSRAAAETASADRTFSTKIDFR